MPGKTCRKWTKTAVARWLAAGLALVAITATACGAPRSALTEPEATAMLEGALHAWNTGDYDRWSRDWSREMKRAIPAAAFAEFREAQRAATGDFVRVHEVTLRAGRQPGPSAGSRTPSSSAPTSSSRSASPGTAGPSKVRSST